MTVITAGLAKMANIILNIIHLLLLNWFWGCYVYVTLSCVVMTGALNIVLDIATYTAASGFGSNERVLLTMNIRFYS